MVAYLALLVTGMAFGAGKEVEMETTLQPIAGRPLTSAFHPGKVWLDERGKSVQHFRKRDHLQLMRTTGAILNLRQSRQIDVNSG